MIAPMRRLLHMQKRPPHRGRPFLRLRSLAAAAQMSVAVNISPLAEAAMMTGSTKLLMLRMVSSCFRSHQMAKPQYAKPRIVGMI